MIKFLLSLLVGLFILTGNAYAEECTFPPVTAVPNTTSTIEQSVYNQINQYRASQGLPTLNRNSALDNQARIHSTNMANGSVSFGHDGFSTRLANSGLSYTSAAENVAYNQGHSDPATKAVQGWLQSSGHLANIKGNFTITGVGVAKNSQNAYYFTQLFMKQ